MNANEIQPAVINENETAFSLIDEVRILVNPTGRYLLLPWLLLFQFI